MGYSGERDDVVDRLANELISVLMRRLYGHHLGCIRLLKAPSEKLIYLYLVLAEPQSFTSIRRSLGLAVKTVDRALRRLRASGCVVQDEVYLYWIMRNKN